MKRPANNEKKKRATKKTKVTYYHCQFCIYTSERRSNVQRHETLHKTLPNKKELLCCNLYFSTKYDHTLHKINNHPNGYTCMICVKTFKRKVLLTRHDAIHTGIKPYKCFYCPSLSNSKSNVMRHCKTQHLGQEVKVICMKKDKDNSKDENLLILNSSKDDELVNESMLEQLSEVREEPPKDWNEQQSEECTNNAFNLAITGEVQVNNHMNYDQVTDEMYSAAHILLEISRNTMKINRR